MDQRGGAKGSKALPCRGQGQAKGIFQMDQLLSECLGERNVPHGSESVDRSLTSLLSPWCIGSSWVRAWIGLSFPVGVPQTAREAGAGLWLGLPCPF